MGLLFHPQVSSLHLRLLGRGDACASVQDKAVGLGCGVTGGGGQEMPLYPPGFPLRLLHLTGEDSPEPPRWGPEQAVPPHGRDLGCRSVLFPPHGPLHPLATVPAAPIPGQTLRGAGGRGGSSLPLSPNPSPYPALTPIPDPPTGKL